MNYDNYYSSADATIYFFSENADIWIKVDTTIAIAYNLTQTSTPIYSLGNRVARYFSTGNTVCNGVLAIAFTDEEYIKYCINYITNPSIGTGSSDKPDEQADGATSAAATRSKPNAINDSSNENFEGTVDGTTKVPAAETETTLPTVRVQATSTEDTQATVSIGSINTLFDIKIFLNNESVFRGSDSKIITLRGVKLTGDSMEINSSSDSFLTTGYKFMFKDIVRATTKK